MKEIHKHYVDTHCHLYLDTFDEDREAMLQRALDAGVKRMYLPNIDTSTIRPMLAMEETFQGHCIPMMGLHPGSVKDNYEDELAEIGRWLNDRPFVAIGEIGTDHYWDKSHVSQQEFAFRRQLEWAREMGLPVVIHSRETIDLNISIVEELQNGGLSGIFHCFTGSLDQAKKITDLGFLLGIGGVLTFKNSHLDNVVKDLSLNYLVLETDSPYLTPDPYRGKRNESAYIPYIGKKVAELLKVSEEQVIQQTTANANRVFSWKS